MLEFLLCYAVSCQPKIITIRIKRKINFLRFCEGSNLRKNGAISNQAKFPPEVRGCTVHLVQECWDNDRVDRIWFFIIVTALFSFA